MLLHQVWSFVSSQWAIHRQPTPREQKMQLQPAHPQIQKLRTYPRNSKPTRPPPPGDCGR